MPDKAIEKKRRDQGRMLRGKHERRTAGLWDGRQVKIEFDRVPILKPKQKKREAKVQKSPVEATPTISNSLRNAAL